MRVGAVLLRDGAGHSDHPSTGRFYAKAGARGLSKSAQVGARLRNVKPAAAILPLGRR